MTYQLYIGANNITGKCEVDKIEKILSANHSGFTILPALLGYWEGNKEDSVSIIISDSARKVHQSIRELKQVLQQDAIGYQRIPDIRFA